MRERIVLAGPQLALLVAACLLGRRRVPVTYVTDGRPPGGYFAGLGHGADGFDLGSVLLEQPAPGAPAADLATYDARVRYDARRFSAQAWSFVEDACDAVPARTAECVVDGRRLPDYLLSNRLDGLAGSGLAPPDANAGPLHPRHKFAPGAWDTLEWAQASRRNHGDAAHERLFAPFLRKLTGDRAWPLAARYHRMGWLPLYYPETMAAALAGRPTGLPEYRFWLPREGWTGAFVGHLVAELRGHASVQLVEEPIAALAAAGPRPRLVLANGTQLEPSFLALGVAQDRAHALLSLPAPRQPAAVSLRLLLAEVRADAIRRPAGCLMCVDPDLRAYRISDQDALVDTGRAWHRVVAEASLGPGTPDSTPAALQALDARLEQDLRLQLGIEANDAVRRVRGITVPRSLSLPSPADVDAAVGDLDSVREATAGAWLCGPLAGFAATSLNDAVVQGLQLAEALR